MKDTTKNAIILLSGGLDSATTGIIARSTGYNCHAMTFRYGQRHVVEHVRAAVGLVDLVIDVVLDQPVDLDHALALALRPRHRRARSKHADVPDTEALLDLIAVAALGVDAGDSL